MPNWVTRKLDQYRRLDVESCNDAWHGVPVQTRYRPLWLEGLMRLALFASKELVSAREAAPSCRILIGVGTQNNYNSARPIFENQPGTAYFTFHNYRLPGVRRLNLFWTYLTGSVSFLSLPLFLAFERRPHVRRALTARTDHVAIAFGARSNIRKFLKSSGAEVLVIMSHGNVYLNVVEEEARRLGMTTVCMMHAPSGRGQLPLQTDYALLDGDFQKALYSGSRAKLLVTGSMRGKLLSAHWRDRSNDKGVIVATNSLLRDLGQIERFVRRLKEQSPGLLVVLRPHPRDRERHLAHREICERTGAVYGAPEQPLYSIGEGCKFLVTGLSGVAVDALMIGLYPLILRSQELDAAWADLPRDYYGLHELGLASHIEMSDPHLPEGRRIGRELEFLDISHRSDWPTETKILEAFELILRERSAAAWPAGAG